jgi:phosphoribosylformimino-5-aminoimidazole carboxamide ribotide isomerase
MHVIPAIDLLDGKAVRLHQGRYDRVTVYDADPAARARAWRGKTERLHVVDLEAAKSGRSTQGEVIREIAREFGRGAQVGGGVRSREAMEALLALGAERVVLGTAAVHDAALVRALAETHPDAVIVAIDAKDGLVATDGWTRLSSLSAVDLAHSLDSLPLAAILYTDITRDGTESGPNVEMTARLAAATRHEVIASGGVGTLDHLRTLSGRGIRSAIVGRALYESRFTIEEASRL